VSESVNPYQAPTSINEPIQATLAMPSHSFEFAIDALEAKRILYQTQRIQIELPTLLFAVACLPIFASLLSPFPIGLLLGFLLLMLAFFFTLLGKLSPSLRRRWAIPIYSGLRSQFLRFSPLTQRQITLSPDVIQLKSTGPIDRVQMWIDPSRLKLLVSESGAVGLFEEYPFFVIPRRSIPDFAWSELNEYATNHPPVAPFQSQTTLDDNDPVSVAHMPKDGIPFRGKMGISMINQSFAMSGIEPLPGTVSSIVLALPTLTHGCMLTLISLLSLAVTGFVVSGQPTALFVSILLAVVTIFLCVRIAMSIRDYFKTSREIEGRVTQTRFWFRRNGIVTTLLNNECKVFANDRLAAVALPNGNESFPLSRDWFASDEEWGKALAQLKTEGL
jgi:hypothetical protein